LLLLENPAQKELTMRLTTRGRYALRASVALALASEDGTPVSISNIAEQEDISSVFLEQIFFKLRKAGIVHSVRGPGGGFCFAQPLNDITISKILEAAGESLTLTPCLENPVTCPRRDTCFVSPIWTDLGGMVNNYFNNITIASIIEQNKEKNNS
jgi:Rrf2 family iron-sulfur cluster assembly transcriptional regulator